MPLPATTIHTPEQAGAYLRDRRKTLKLSQSQAGRRLGISQNRFSALESDPGAISLERLLVLANLLGLELVLRLPVALPESSTGEHW